MKEAFKRLILPSEPELRLNTRVFKALFFILNFWDFFFFKFLSLFETFPFIAYFKILKIIYNLTEYD